MKTTIPTLKTQAQAPSREGLVFHEIVADGLIHEALVFGISDDERFVERVLSLAWVNAARLVQTNFWQAAKLAKSLSETLEVGRRETEKLCHDIGRAIASLPEDPFAAIRGYYEEVRQCRALDRSDPEFSDHVRHLIGEGLLGGLYSRGVIPESFATLVAHSMNTRHEQRFLSNRLIHWAQNQGLPNNHPFVSLCTHLYKNSLECDLLCCGIARQVPLALGREDPWSLDHWLTLGWKDGYIVASFAPDVMRAVISATPDSWEFNQRLLKECIFKAPLVKEVNLPAAFLDYFTRYEPFDFKDESERAANPRMMAWCAYDFAFWMAVTIEELGRA